MSDVSDGVEEQKINGRWGEWNWGTKEQIRITNYKLRSVLSVCYSSWGQAWVSIGGWGLGVHAWLPVQSVKSNIVPHSIALR